MNERPIHPVLPPAINEEVFAPKRQMQAVKEVAQKRLKKFHGKFEKAVRKFLKKNRLAGDERYLRFYDLGYRFEAVFTEITSDGSGYVGQALEAQHGDLLTTYLQAQLKLPQGDSLIALEIERSEDGDLEVIKMVAVAEHAEIQRLSEKVQGAPRQNNPGS